MTSDPDRSLRSRKPRIAIFEDDVDLAAEISDILDRSGFTPVRVRSEAELRACLDDPLIDLLICDLRSPAGNPVDVMAGGSARLPILLISGAGPRAMDAAEEAARRLGFEVVDQLAKPFGADNLLRRVNRALQLRRSWVPEESAPQPERAGRWAEALGRGEFVPYLQPKARVADRSIAGYEILARWIGPAGETRPPSAFRPLLEDPEGRRGLAISLLKQVVSVAGRDLARSGRGISLNLASTDFAEGDFIETILAILRENRLPAELLTLEVTEDQLLAADVDELRGMLRVSLLGVGLSVDDFGTGMTRMHDLFRLPVSEVKFDREILKRSSAGNPGLLVSLAGVARSLGLRSVVEGVETAADFESARVAGIDQVQGFLTGRPQPLQCDLIHFGPFPAAVPSSPDAAEAGRPTRRPEMRKAPAVSGDANAC